MEREKLQAWRDWVRAELESCVSFWLEHGMDKEHGGVYTCLTRDGKVFSTDKSVWMQGRCAWTFSYLCRVYGKKQEWLDAAKSCLDFLEEHCINRTAGDRLYFTVTADRCASAGTASQKAFTPSATRSITARRASGNIWSARAKRISWCMT